MVLEAFFSCYNEVESETVDPRREEGNGTPRPLQGLQQGVHCFESKRSLIEDKSGYRHKQVVRKLYVCNIPNSFVSVGNHRHMVHIYMSGLRTCTLFGHWTTLMRMDGS